MLTPLLLADLVRMLGLGRSAALVVTAAIALYHGRSLLLLLGRLGTWLRIAGLFGFTLVLAMAGLIPGVDLAIDVGTLGRAVGGLARALWNLLPLGEVLP